MVRFELEQTVFAKAGGHLSQRPTELLLQKGFRQPMCCPRYVSGWCMSKRKRCFDLAFSSVALLLFSPVMVLIGGLIRITSKGPALFRQERVGLHQQTFTIFKFRTMKDRRGQADRGLTVTKQGDPRMNRVGALLRRLKLDELPQLINVVRGDMSFVGPRPKIPEHENLCMLCRPGITGAATIEFSHEESLLTDVPAEFVERYVMSVLNPEKCQIDSTYIETSTFWTDLRILMHTLFELSNRPKRSLALGPAISHQVKPTMVRFDSNRATSVESAEFSTQEIFRST